MLLFAAIELWPLVEHAKVRLWQRFFPQTPAIIGYMWRVVYPHKRGIVITEETEAELESTPRGLDHSTKGAIDEEACESTPSRSGPGTPIGLAAPGTVRSAAEATVPAFRLSQVVPIKSSEAAMCQSMPETNLEVSTAQD